MAHAALTIAKYFLALPDKDSGDLMSNLKLQKLLYYAQGYYVALHGVANPLFNDKIYAWKHGPVVQSVYKHYSSAGVGAIPKEIMPNISEETQAFLNEIYRVLGRFSAWVLRDMTHKETPWLDNYKPNVLNIEIPLSDLQKYFSKNVKKK